MDSGEPSTTPQPPRIPKWLRKLQQQSWQAEILISGGAFIGLINLIDEIPVLFGVLIHTTTLSLERLLPVPIAGMFIIFLLIEGFVVHLILRGFWIGLVGLNDVFPDGVRTDKLRFRGKFESFFKERSNTPYLVRLDKLASLVFALTFLAVFSTFAIVAFLAVLLWITPLTDAEDSWVISGVQLLLLLLAFLQLLDFITLGRLRRNKWFSKIYYPFYTITSAITLSFLYRRLYYTIVSNIRPVYVILIACVPTAVVVAFNSSFNGTTGALSSRFVPNNSRHARSLLYLPDPVVRDTLLRFTVAHLPRLEEEIIKEWTETHKEGSDPVDSLESVQSLYLATSRYKILVDSTEIKNPYWLASYEESVGFFNSRITRFTCIVNIAGVRAGTHRLTVRINSTDKGYKFASQDFAFAYFIIP